MNPSFALSLSQEGIVLSQRSAAGWTVLGSADPALPSLDDDLAGLRRMAGALSNGSVGCRIVIPNDQVRYLSVETPGMAREARFAAARDALDGVTPYAIEDLVFDIHMDGDLTHVAAVARETLAEAETFAICHGFEPLVFAAQPEAGNPFATEPDFGPSELARQAKAAAVSAAADAPEDGTVEQGPAAAEAADSAGDAVAALPEPGFVSRRTVPTFRTAPPEAVVARGFAEPQTPYTPPPARRAARSAAADVVPAPAPVVRRTTNEAERLTIYGARDGSMPGRRKSASGIAVLLGVIAVAAIAAFAGGATTSGLTALFSRVVTSEPEPQFTAPRETAVAWVEEADAPDALPAPRQTLPDTPGDDRGILSVAPESEADTDVEIAALDPALTDVDAAVLDALRAPTPDVTEPVAPPSEESQGSAHAESGIWTTAPDVPVPSPPVDIENLYMTGIDPIEPKFDAVALPRLRAEDHDRSFAAPASPAPAGTRFDLDASGLVVPTAAGSLNPDGIPVFAGPPRARPPATLVKLEDPGEDMELKLRLAAIPPRPRPADLIESSERAVFSGLTRSELGEIRPQVRPLSAQENAQREALASASLVRLDDSGAQSLLEAPEGTDFDSATARAIVASLRPDPRPEDFERTVAKALESAPPPATTAPGAAATAAAAATATVAPKSVAPKIPSSASVSREATVKNAINLRKVNLIGVYGTPSNRRALVRYGDGQYRKVQVGDRIDGGRVSAIGDSELRYQKSGRAIVLTMPRG